MLDVTPHSLVDVYKNFKGMCCLIMRVLIYPKDGAVTDNLVSLKIMTWESIRIILRVIVGRQGQTNKKYLLKISPSILTIMLPLS
jgi:hypothetical protein